MRSEFIAINNFREQIPNLAIKKKPRASFLNKPKTHSKNLSVNYKERPHVKTMHLNTFEPILEEDNFDNVIVNSIQEDAKQVVNGPSYLDAIKFASVYNHKVK